MGQTNIMHHVFKTVNVAEVQVKFQKVEHPVRSILGVPVTL